ncbi:phospholipid-binding lipoprotein MlaA [Azotobacter beijerinckii]|uniref:Phospholipid-binding lipoprotein MlaA n=1 Tax=Azotobacter beijerinckii TaxID=170623 RepID=A0A1H6XHK7_9GAMM|nr:VacJ family lipoprotein [Azotobacter beijerinckii]SEI98972.1 phospholipid-binding lipoprotein MlaA [Azotobacter beijerinckii]SEJ28559.1 phospholipid-binding lipoprotein MlaA [Azotobacter beijerinckii]
MRVIATDQTKRLGRSLVCAGLALLPMVAAVAEEDPWEGFNRPIFRFNDTLDRYFMKPVAKGYQAIAPQFVEDGVHNAYRNIGDVGNLANNLLQAKFHDAGVDTSRLLLNTTVGVLGVVDVGTKMGLDRNDEDFGQTLGAWGVPSGHYVVLPFFGPSTIRDTGGLVGDAFTKPYPYMESTAARYGLFVGEVVDTRASLLAAEKVITGDRYIFIRDAYLQNREFKVKDGKVEDDF